MHLWACVGACKANVWLYTWNFKPYINELKGQNVKYEWSWAMNPRNMGYVMEHYSHSVMP